MILASSVRAYVCAEPIDMRKQIDGLAQLVEPVFAADVFGGQVFVFLGKRRNKVKLLWWDRHGFFLLYKRLERGRFPRPEEFVWPPVRRCRNLAGLKLLRDFDGRMVGASIRPVS